MFVKLKLLTLMNLAMLMISSISYVAWNELILPFGHSVLQAANWITVIIIFNIVLIKVS